MNNQETATPSQTTGDSTGGSSAGSTVDSTEVRGPRGWIRWTLEELVKIQSLEIRDGFYLASRHGRVKEFLAEHFPGRSLSSVYGKIWRYEHGKDRKFFPKK